MDTVLKLSQYAKQIDYPINIIGIPKTIDNDLAITDHTRVWFRRKIYRVKYPRNCA
jgi:hypothetical protein